MKRTNKVTTAKLDTLFSKIIRSVGKCHRCGSTYGLQCAHLISRRYHQVRWAKENAICLCQSCHVYFTYRPIEWEEYIKTKIHYPEYYAEMKQRALRIGKIDKKEIYENLTLELS